jgi:hypothetical protein
LKKSNAITPTDNIAKRERDLEIFLPVVGEMDRENTQV